MLKKYFKIWWMMAIKQSKIQFTSRVNAAMFILGKIMRFFFFLVFLFLLEAKTKTIGGYTVWQVILFFMTFNLVDTTAQLFLREVYGFRSYILYGEFDYFLVKPISPLFRSLFGGSDILDLSTLILTISFIIFAAGKIGTFSILEIALYVLLVLNALAIALAFHIFVISVGVITTEVDNTLWLYRDLTQMGRIPVDLYKEPLRGFLTFIIPIGIMMTFPAKAFMGILSWQFVVLSFLISFVFLFLTLNFWKYSLKNYTSASS